MLKIAVIRFCKKYMKKIDNSKRAVFQDRIISIPSVLLEHGVKGAIFA
jgi:hypothetical protein